VSCLALHHNRCCHCYIPSIADMMFGQSRSLFVSCLMYENVKQEGANVPEENVMLVVRQNVHRVVLYESSTLLEAVGILLDKVMTAISHRAFNKMLFKCSAIFFALLSFPFIQLY
jgi:hypothetical protein